MITNSRRGWVTGILFLTGLAVGAQDRDKQTKEDLAAFGAHLKKNYPGKKWQTGPAAMASAEIDKAYGKRRFYFVFSAPPLPPGANIKSVQEAYRQRLADFTKNYISLTVAMDENGKIETFTKAEDFNRGLMAVTNAHEARLAAAAVLSLHGSGRVGPGRLASDQVKITPKDKGWTAQVHVKNHYFGSVTFNDKGRVQLVSKQYAGPFPP